MTKPTVPAIYDPTRTYEDNFRNGPHPIPGDRPAARHRGEPKHEFLGYKINSPFGIAAGPLLNRNYVKWAFDRGFDVVCYKTQRSRPSLPNEFPHIVALDIEGDLTLEQAARPQPASADFSRPLNRLTITNSLAVPSLGPDFWVADLRQALADQRPGQLLIMCVQGTISADAAADDYYDDFATTARLAVDAGAPVIEVNLSCPNIASECVICRERAAVGQICRRVRSAIGSTPLIIKLGYFAPDQQDLLEAILRDVAPLIDAVSAVNTIPATIVDRQGAPALPGRDTAGVCGAAIRWAGVDMTRRLHDLRRRHGYGYQIIGVGGVMGAADFATYREAGADLVQSATAAMWNPRLATEIKTWLQENSAP